MAYGNWGAFVYRNGERMPRWEDATPYDEQERDPGYYQAFARGIDPTFNPHHAVLGSKSVRLCGYKCYPVLFVGGERVDDLSKYGTGKPDEYGDHSTYEGSVDGHEFRAEKRDNFVDLWLKEPDGDEWTATCGFEYGAGHMEG